MYIACTTPAHVHVMKQSLYDKSDLNSHKITIMSTMTCLDVLDLIYIVYGKNYVMQETLAQKLAIKDGCFSLEHYKRCLIIIIHLDLKNYL